MTKMKKIRFKWINRKHPLIPTALTAKGETALRLLEKISDLDDETISKLKGGAFENLIFITGENDNLPWTDGVSYYGYDPDTNNLLLPSHSKPDLNAGLIEQAFGIKGATHYILMKESNTLISTSGALPLNRSTILRWIETK